MARRIRAREALRLRASGLSQNAIARAAHIDLCQDFGHGIERNHAAIGIASGLGSGRSKKSAMASAGTL